MCKIGDLVPKHKSDTSSIEKLKNIEPCDVEPILENLMEWIQDINWPVAKELIKVLPRFHIQLISIIHNIFKSDDDIWKCWTITLLRDFPQETLKEFKPDLERMANFPTKGEKLEYVDEEASEILESFL